MNTESQYELHARPILNPLFMFRWEETQQAYVLLYPEGVVKLNDTAGEILKRCNGTLTVEELVQELTGLFDQDAGKVGESVQKFLEVSHAKGWIRRQA